MLRHAVPCCARRPLALLATASGRRRGGQRSKAEEGSRAACAQRALRAAAPQRAAPPEGRQRGPFPAALARLVCPLQEGGPLPQGDLLQPGGCQTLLALPRQHLLQRRRNGRSIHPNILMHQVVGGAGPGAEGGSAVLLALQPQAACGVRCAQPQQRPLLTLPGPFCPALLPCSAQGTNTRGLPGQSKCQEIRPQVKRL